MTSLRKTLYISTNKDLVQQHGFIVLCWTGLPIFHTLPHQIQIKKSDWWFFLILNIQYFFCVYAICKPFHMGWTCIWVSKRDISVYLVCSSPQHCTIRTFAYCVLSVAGLFKTVCLFWKGQASSLSHVPPLPLRIPVFLIHKKEQIHLMFIK